MDELRKPGVTALLASLIGAIHGGQGVAVPTNGGVPSRRRRSFKPPGGGAEWTWEAFEGTLTAGHRKFLEVVATQGTIGLDEAAEALGLPGKGVGGLVGSLVRKAANRGVALPFEAMADENGGRTWKWTAGSPA